MQYSKVLDCLCGTKMQYSKILDCLCGTKMQYSKVIDAYVVPKCNIIKFSIAYVVPKCNIRKFSIAYVVPMSHPCPWWRRRMSWTWDWRSWRPRHGLRPRGTDWSNLDSTSQILSRSEHSWSSRNLKPIRHNIQRHIDGSTWNDTLTFEYVPLSWFSDCILLVVCILFCMKWTDIIIIGVFLYQIILVMMIYKYYLVPRGGCELLFWPGLSVCLSVCLHVCLSVCLCVRPIFWYFIQIDLHRSKVNIRGTVHCFVNVQSYHKNWDIDKIKSVFVHRLILCFCS